MVNLRGDRAPKPNGFPNFLNILSLEFGKSDTRLLLTGVRARGEYEPYVFDVERGALTRATVEARLNAIGWAPGGDSILYALSGDQLFVRAVDGSGVASPTIRLRDGTFSGTLSAWGPWVAFSSQQGTDVRRLGIAHLDSADRVRWISQTGTDSRSPAISTDGQWLAFTSNENGRDEVFVTTFPVPDGRYLVSIGGGRSPSWARDSRTLYFQQGNEIQAASFTPGVKPVIGSPRVHFRRDPWGAAAVSSDGEQLVFADVAREGAPVALALRLHALRGK